MNSNYNIILASASPRRRELLSLFELPFDIRPAHIDETPYPNEAPIDFVKRMAKEKASSLILALQSQKTEKKDRKLEIVITADTTVTIDGKILNKPANTAEAVEMLKTLRGRTHQVLTAITLIQTQTGETIHEFCSSDVPMRNYSDGEIDTYVASGDPLDKAGGYAIQHQGFHPVENFSHCYASVMGLPLCHLARAMKKLNVPLNIDVPMKCQDFNRYSCSIYREIL